MGDYALEYRILNAQNNIFSWMAEYIGYDRKTGSEALAPFGFDWVEAWENWWDEGEIDG